METNSGTTKILEKGPEYLRKQMDLESEAKGRMSAVERLAATKPKYCKSQQVVNATQESLLSIGSASVSSNGSSNRSSNRSGNPDACSDSTGNAEVKQSCLPGQMRRPGSKKRPDSLLLHRQKCDLVRGSANDRKHQINRKLLLGSVTKNVPLLETPNKECVSEGIMIKITTPEGTTEESESHTVISPSEKRSNGMAEECINKSSDSGAKTAAGGPLELPEFRSSGKGVSRSHSDISSRYSKNFADFDVFFKYCGLDGDIVESLGKENFSAHSDEIAINIRSISVSTSDDGFSRSSGDSDGLLGDELQKKMQQGTSVIERNARIIKWLYSCRNATETGKKLRDLD